VTTAVVDSRKNMAEKAPSRPDFRGEILGKVTAADRGLVESPVLAAGNTLEEAILQGFFELVEREAFAIWWYNWLRLPEVDVESFGDEYLASAREYYRRLHRDMWVLDVTGDLGIPVFVALSRRTDAEAELNPVPVIA